MNARIRHFTVNTLPVASLMRPALAVVTLAFACCAGASAASSTWAPNAPRDKTYSKVLVVGVSSDADQRCMFEEFMASQMSSASTEVIQSCDQAQPVTPPTRAAVEQMVAATGADAVLATRLISTQATDQTGGSRDTRGGDYFKAEGTADATGPWGYYDVPVVYGQYEEVPAINLLEGRADVTSHFYATQGPVLIYTVGTTVKHIETTDGGIASIAADIADRLRREGLVK